MARGKCNFRQRDLRVAAEVAKDLGALIEVDAKNGKITIIPNKLCEPKNRAAQRSVEHVVERTA